MTNTKKKVGYCEFCKKLSVGKDIYTIYRIGFTTNRNFYTVGVLEVIDELNKYVFDKGYHLSSTQVILLRPDILITYLRKRYNKENEMVTDCSLFQAEACNKCYEEYKQEIPDK